MTLSNENDEPPVRIPWPPLLIALTIAGGLALDALAPIPLAPSMAVQFAGGALVALALVNDIWCARALWRHKTTILPHHPVSHLVADGPYRYSRNPIYVSHVVLTFGVGLLLRSPWIVLLAPLLVVGLTRLAIVPEERHLSRKFGADFAAYAARTRRWL
jgi:protein-S-isoprenylcysteine O-methyltransferase Ste14